MTSLGWSASFTSFLSSYYARTRNGASLLAMLFLACAPSITRAQEPAEIGRWISDLRSRNVRTRETAVDSLVHAGPSSIRLLLESMPHAHTQILLVLSRQGSAALPDLIALTNDPVLGARAGEAIFQAAHPDGARYAKDLLDCLKNRPEVKNYCGSALVKVMSPKAVACRPMLIEAAKNDDPEVRAYAVGALSQLGAAASPAVPVMASLLNDSVPAVRWASISALGRLGRTAASARPALLAIRGQSEDPEASRLAREALRTVREAPRK